MAKEIEKAQIETLNKELSDTIIEWGKLKRKYNGPTEEHELEQPAKERLTLCLWMYSHFGARYKALIAMGKNGFYKDNLLFMQNKREILEDAINLCLQNVDSGEVKYILNAMMSPYYAPPNE